jgi:hypothetical protein
MYKILRTLAVLAVALLMTLAMLVPAAAGSSDRPFKGVIVGGGTAVPDATCPLGIRTVMWGTGEVAHLGLTEMTASHCSPDWGAPILGGVQTFVAANGDKLEMTYTATVEPFVPEEGAIMVGPGDTVITGGTGRFADASGEFVANMRGILHFTAPMELTWTLYGEIGY